MPTAPTTPSHDAPARATDLARALAVTVVARAAAALAAPVEPAWDGWYYARAASSIARGAGYAEPDGAGMRATAFYPVGYPAAMAAALGVTGDARLAAVLVNVLAASLACACVWRVAGAVAGPRAALLAAMAYALYPGAVLWSAAAMTETLAGALLALSLALTVTRGDRLAGSAGAGLALGLATLVRPQSLLLLPLAALRARGPWRRVAHAVVAAAALAAVVAPWTMRNCARLDACALVSTNGGVNLLIGTLPASRGGFVHPDAAHPCNRVRGEVARDRCFARAGRDRVAEHPAAWLGLVARKLVVTFAWEHDPVSYLRGARRDVTAPAALAVALCTAAWWALVALALRATVALRARDEAAVAAARWGAGAVAVVAVTHGVFLGADRYHLLLVPLLCPAAGAALARRSA